MPRERVVGATLAAGLVEPVGGAVTLTAAPFGACVALWSADRAMPSATPSPATARAPARPSPHRLRPGPELTVRWR